ncbi:VTT domain-containing protein [Geomesophilobacter sediminis]|uniref:VTT domain-containing protein n=1 Tax=Geomesophilobacter sediminis TaxID=2798584 RepID=A0A8J7LUX0_9BACT|nr:VTT domain-containing protein [Geomesophilobacter sediminis]MBJ6725144.1 VTT domain-containing protein [Geomesophilobacter sediminis]
MATSHPIPGRAGQALDQRLNQVREGCTSCGACTRDCAFLQKYGTPKRLAETYDRSDPETVRRSFECSLCGLCETQCPEGLELDAFFLEMRRDAVERGEGIFPEHRPLVTYERLGTSPRFTLYRLPQGCRTVFFPGCSLAGTRPDGVRNIFAALQKAEPTAGIVFDCCMKPSHMLGRERQVDTMFSELRQWLIEAGVREVLVACPNCQAMFAAFGAGLKVKTVWEALDAAGFEPTPTHGVVTVHDPCVVRNFPATHQAVRNLLRRQGVAIEEMAHSGTRTVCCGKGGAVDMLNPELAASWGELRKEEAAGRWVVTYCAGCVQGLGRYTSTDHLVDLLFAPEQTLAGRKKGAAAPFTYVNRLLLKRSFKRKEGFAVTKERNPQPGQPARGPWKPILAALLLIAAVAAVQLSGGTQYLQQERLQALIGSYGALAPAAYVLLYALAPVLFLPGLPITIVGGIVFGPVWGVVYTIVGATAGASLAFLVARYVARDWVAAKLTGPRWDKLDREVAQHGWKVVAFTRLIPAFPFNLLNYAFGLTSVSFLQYLVATFVCMLPACIAYIVFSSSLLGLISGKVSPTALVGIVLIALVSLLPVAYRKIKGRTAVEAGQE